MPCPEEPEPVLPAYTAQGQQATTGAGREPSSLETASLA